MPFMFCSLPLTLNRQAFVSYVGTVWSVLFHCCLSSNSQNLSHSFSNGKVWREPSPSPPRPGGGYPFSPTKRTRNTSCCTFIVVLGGRQGSISASNVQTLIDTKVVFFFHYPSKSRKPCPIAVCWAPNQWSSPLLSQLLEGRPHSVAQATSTSIFLCPFLSLLLFQAST